MRYSAFATDYDGTLASQGSVAEATLDALERLKRSGRKLLLVTGREMDDIVHVFPALSIFDRVVSENGAVSYRPDDRSERLLARRPSERLLTSLRKRNVSPLGFGRIVIGSSRDQTPKIIEAIRESGADSDVIFNKASVMVLPRGVNKATGLRAALEEIRISTDCLVTVGDGENDIPILEMAARGVAVAGALAPVKLAADFVLRNDAGDGVIELIERLLETDSLPEQVSRHAAAMGSGAMLENVDRLPDAKR